MQLEDLLIEYGKLQGLGKLHLNSSGVCHLKINGSLVISLEKSLDGKGFHLYAIIGNLSDNKAKEIALSALMGNLFGKETGRATLGYESQTHSLVLSEYFEENTTDLMTFKENLVDFVRHLTYWIAKLEELLSMKEESFEKNVVSQPDLKDSKVKIFFA